MSSTQPEPGQNNRDQNDSGKDRRRRFEEALEDVNAKHGRALEKLAEHPSLEEQRDEHGTSNVPDRQP